MGLFDFLKINTTNILGIDFPKFKGSGIYGYHKKTERYERKDYYYYLNEKCKRLQNNYIETLNANGFMKTNNIKYTKYNAYVIVEALGNTLHIALHVNK